MEKWILVKPATMQPSAMNGNATTNGNTLITPNNSTTNNSNGVVLSSNTPVTSTGAGVVTSTGGVTVTNGGGISSQSSTPTQSITPPGNNAPKYGTLVPNRVFVGGISANTTEVELAQLFSTYGTVKATKIISDRAGVSKGYGFVTFESEEEAKRLQREADNIVLRERKLNIAPAIKKQPFSRPLDGTTPGSPPGLTAIPTLSAALAKGLKKTYHFYGNCSRECYSLGAGPAAAGFGYFPSAAAANAVNAAAALNGPYFQNGGVTYYNPAIPANSGPGADPTSGVYPAAALYPGGAATSHTGGPPVSVTQQSANSAAVQQQQQACAATAAVVQQNIAAQNAAAIAAAAAAGYPAMLYPPMYMPAGAHPQQYATYPGHVPSSNGFLTADATGIPYSLAPQPTYVLLDTIQY
ncbi:RNA-binding protein Musashi homolog 2-like isoform X2 [Chrysoperla carnea]|uniref:RNA-binding protein Musashi homolog 2-like isoform X2 n=1 Tax=Chrysoperla carnea TaxID=189513 RepID=UPI001D07A737|nr:RNA-binding protein Musashi homolog 2-like isoform X2 [Chrysoperla carnea]